MVKPNPRGPRLTMMGALSELISGEKSRQGEASRDDAVDDPPPGEARELAAAAAAAAATATPAGQSSVGIMRESPVAEEDLTMGRTEALVMEVLGLAPPPLLFVFEGGMGDVSNGLGVLGSTESLGVTGRLLGPAAAAADSADSILRLAKTSGVVAGVTGGVDGDESGFTPRRAAAPRTSRW